MQSTADPFYISSKTSRTYLWWIFVNGFIIGTFWLGEWYDITILKRQIVA